MTAPPDDPSAERWGWTAALGALLCLLGAPLSVLGGLSVNRQGALAVAWGAALAGSLMCLGGSGLFFLSLKRLRTASPLLFRRALTAFLVFVAVELAVALLMLL